MALTARWRQLENPYKTVLNMNFPRKFLSVAFDGECSAIFFLQNASPKRAPGQKHLAGRSAAGAEGRRAQATAALLWPTKGGIKVSRFELTL